MRGARDVLAAGGAFVAAFLAAGHHAIHMALISAGIGAFSFLLTPSARRIMLIVSLTMAALALWWGLRHRAPTGHDRGVRTWAVLAAGAFSIAVIGWTVTRDGW